MLIILIIYLLNIYLMEGRWTNEDDDMNGHKEQYKNNDDSTLHNFSAASENSNKEKKYDFNFQNVKNAYNLITMYDINQLLKEEKHSLLKIKINPNFPNELVLINSNFQISYFSLCQDGLFHINTLEREHTDRVNDICYFKNCEGPFNQAIISASSDGSIKIWDSRAKSSVKTIKNKDDKQIFCVETTRDYLIAGMEREISIWDVKMMKQLYKSKFAHSEDVTFLKAKQNILLSGGEDNIVNIFDISMGLSMDSVMATANIGQPISSLDFLDEDLNYVQVITTVKTYEIFNMYTASSLFEFDAKNVNIY
jgi:WD40 repeat protein